MGYTKFSSYDFILNYNYKTKGEVNDALSALDAMYANGSIGKYQYENATALLKDKLKCL